MRCFSVSGRNCAAFGIGIRQIFLRFWCFADKDLGVCGLDLLFIVFWFYFAYSGRDLRFVCFRILLIWFSFGLVCLVVVMAEFLSVCVCMVVLI